MGLVQTSTADSSTKHEGLVGLDQPMTDLWTLFLKPANLRLVLDKDLTHDKVV